MPFISETFVCLAKDEAKHFSHHCDDFDAATKYQEYNHPHHCDATKRLDNNEA